MKTKGKTIVKGERRNTADQRKTIHENERGRKTADQEKTKKAPTSRRDYFKVLECFSSFALYVVMILFLKISFVLRVQN